MVESFPEEYYSNDLWVQYIPGIAEVQYGTCIQCKLFW